MSQICFGRNECPDQRGLRLSLLLNDDVLSRQPERMPRPEGIATSRHLQTSLDGVKPERMPRPEGIATHVGLNHRQNEHGAGTNAPTRGDCDVIRLYQIRLRSFAGTNAPTRGDCDVDKSALTIFLPEKAGTNAPTRGDCDAFLKLLEEFVQLAGTNAPTRGDCDCLSLCFLFLSIFGRNECPDQRGLRPYPVFHFNHVFHVPERMPRPEGIATSWLPSLGNV